MALYIASDKPLLIIAWRPENPSFHVIELQSAQEAARAQFTFPHVYYVGSREKCGCPFNHGREFPEDNDDPVKLAEARDDVALLSAYVLDGRVRQIYACQFDEEHEVRKHQRHVTSQQLREDDFVFQDRELLEVDHAA